MPKEHVSASSAKDENEFSLVLRGPNHFVAGPAVEYMKLLCCILVWHEYVANLRSPYDRGTG